MRRPDKIMHRGHVIEMRMHGQWVAVTHLTLPIPHHNKIRVTETGAIFAVARDLMKSRIDDHLENPMAELERVRAEGVALAEHPRVPERVVTHFANGNAVFKLVENERGAFTPRMEGLLVQLPDGGTVDLKIPQGLDCTHYYNEHLKMKITAYASGRFTVEQDVPKPTVTESL